MLLSGKPSLSWMVLPSVAGGATMVGLLALSASHCQGSGAPLSALCSLVVLAAAHRRARVELRAEPDRAFAYALAPVGMIPYLLGGLWLAHVATPWIPARPYWGDPVFVGAAAAAVLAIAVLEFVVVDRRVALRPTLARARRPLTALAMLLSLWGLARGLTRPVLDPTPRDLRAVATLTPPNYLDPVQDHAVGRMVLTLGCPRMSPDTSTCYAVARRSEADPFPAGWSHGSRMPSLDGQHGASFDARAPVDVMRDERHDLWILQQRLTDERRPFAAFRGRDLQRVEVTLHDRATEYAPPRGWCFAGLGGALLAWWLVHRRPRLPRAPRHGALDATPTGEHGLRLSDGSLVAAPADAVLPPGPVVVMPTREGAGPFRESLGVRVLWEGTLADWRALNTAEDDLYAALAVSTLALAATPLVAAAWWRLLG